jgi:hypothetical protein
MAKRKDIQAEKTEADTVKRAAAEVAKAAAALAAPKGVAPSPVGAAPAPVLPETAAAPLDSGATVTPSAPTRRFALLAASVAVAAVLGSTAGSLITAELHGSSTPTALTVTQAPASASPEAVARVGADVAALKASLEATNRNANTQLARMGERFDRIEHAQSEPAAKLAKIAESLDRLEHRPATTIVASADTTGSIGDARAKTSEIKAADLKAAEAKAGEAKAAEAKAAEAKAAEAKAKPTIVDGWSIADVRRGRIYVESRYGVFEVVPGMRLPNLGRVEDVARQNGQLVVVTSKGLITR